MNVGIYPSVDDKDFYKKLINKQEFYENNRSGKQLGKLTNYQKIVKNFLNPNTYYNSLLVYASVGVGKTLLSISVAENYKSDYKILVCLKNETLVNSYKNELKHFNINEKGYTFITYNDLLSSIIGNRVYKVNLEQTEIQYNKKTKNFNLNNTLLIIDEAHNITDIKLYSVLLEILKVSIDTKLLLLSATPVYDNIIEIFQINNLLNFGKTFQLPVSEKELLKAKLITTHPSNSDLLNDTSNNLTKLGKDTLKVTLKGKISYYKINGNSNYANVKFMGTPISNIYLKSTSKNSGSLIKKDSVNICISKMSEFQSEVYNKTLKDPDNTLFKNSIDASTIVYPDGSIGSAGFIANKKNMLFLKKENINKYSSKLHTLLLALDKLKGSCFIYSNFVNNRGTDLIRMVLLKNGYMEFRMSDITKNKNAFVILKGSVSQKTLSNYLRIFNSPENKNGDLIKIIIGSPIINEGITLKNIRQIHILEPTWNFSKIDQIIGRGVRYLSHIDLPISERNVYVYLHCSVTGNGNGSVKSNIEESIDYLKYLLSYRKDIAIKQIEYLLRSISIDCNLNYFVTGTDYSRDCLYEKCNYSCPSKLTGKIDKSTYVLKFHNPDEYNYILNKIIQLFSGIGFIYDFKHIVDFVGNFNLNHIKLVLYDIIKNKIKINGKVLVNSGGYFIAKKINETIKKITPIKKPSPIKKINKKNVKKNIKVLDKPVYATFIDGVFRIIFNEKPSKNDLRTVSIGKECTFYTKQDLVNIGNTIGIKFDVKLNKDEICNIIFEKLQEKNLVL
jgi:superfamily II DNA or RNA helicase